MILVVAGAARYWRRLDGGWRTVFVVTSVTALYFNVFVLLAQLFAKIPGLIILAPSQKSPVFGATELVALVLFLFVGRAALRGSRSDKVAVPH